MQEVLGELAFKVPPNKSSFMISSENEEFFDVKAAAHNVCLVMKNGVIRIILAQNLLIVISFGVWPNV